MRLTNNDRKLSEYFSKKIRTGLSIPYITKISNETGISISTISRYANRKGYYNFPEMRANINNQLENSPGQLINYTFVKNFIKKYKNKKIVIASSVSCQSIGYHFAKRLDSINIKSRFIDNSYENKNNIFKNISKNEVIIFITISGQSAWLSSLIQDYKNTVLVISMNHLNTLPKKYENISILSKHDFITAYNKYESVRKIFLWVDDILNTIVLENEK